MNLVSVIMPYYRNRISVKKSIISILNQSYKKLELIIIYDDNDLTDFHFLKKIQKTDKRIFLIKNKKNIGAGLSRNIGIKKAKGHFISFLDSDDVWSSNKIKTQLKFMIKNKIDCCHTSYKIFKNGKISQKRNARSFYDYHELLKSCDIGLSTVMLKKKILKGQIRFPNLRTKEDFVLWLKILKSNINIIALNKYLTKWQKTENSLSSSSIQKLKDGFLVYYKFMNFNFIKSIYYLVLLSLNFIVKNI